MPLEALPGGIPLPVAGAAAVALMLVIVLSLAAVAATRSPRAQLRRRAKAIAAGSAAVTAEAAEGGGKRRSSTRGAKAMREAAEVTGRNDKKAKAKATIRQRLEEAGLEASPRSFYIASAVCGFVGTALYLLMGMPPMGAIPVFIVAVLGLPRYYLRFKAKRRRDKFTAGFADALDIIVRGIRSGLPVGECLNIIARESPDPIGTEFQRIVEAEKLGLTLQEAMERAVRRMPTAEMRFFAVVLIMQRETGGNLGEALANLAEILRKRKKMKDKVKAMSAEAKMTASIIGSMPFILTGIIYLIAPDYIGTLWTTTIGNFLLVGGIVWMGIGIFVMKQLVSFEI